MIDLSYSDLLAVNGGEIDSFSDVLIIAGSALLCVASPPVGVGVAVTVILGVIW
jgi:hypothetical protein